MKGQSWVIEQNNGGMSEKHNAGVTQKDMVKTVEWSEKRNGIVVSGQDESCASEQDKRGVRKQSKDNTAVV